MKNFIFIGCILLVSNACNLPESKPLKLEKDATEMTDELKALNDFEDAAVKWSVRTTNDTTTAMVVIELFNGANLSKNDDDLRKIGREAVRVVANSISNENDYDNFQVVFIQQMKVGIASASTSKRFDYTGKDVK